MPSRHLSENGFELIRAVVSPEEIRKLTESFASVFEEDAEGVLARSSYGHVYAARNFLRSIPETLTVWRTPALFDYLSTELGDSFGLVRALYFDKPPGRTWALAWHKDCSIAVRNHAISSSHFTRPTLKAGVPHVIAADAILLQMLTLRIHLDDADSENGALRVVPGSHLSSESIGRGTELSVEIQCRSGDVLAMRPLLTHSSGASQAGTHRHRRILHLEFAGQRDLPDGYQWYDFIPNSDLAHQDSIRRTESSLLQDG